jgi:hypothetical protein
MRGMYRKNLAALAFTVSPPDHVTAASCRAATSSNHAVSIGTFTEPCGAVRCEHLIGPVN